MEVYFAKILCVFWLVITIFLLSLPSLPLARPLLFSHTSLLAFQRSPAAADVNLARFTSAKHECLWQVGLVTSLFFAHLKPPSGTKQKARVISPSDQFLTCVILVSSLLSSALFLFCPPVRGYSSSDWQAKPSQCKGRAGPEQIGVRYKNRHNKRPIIDFLSAPPFH